MPNIILDGDMSIRGKKLMRVYQIAERRNGRFDHSSGNAAVFKFQVGDDKHNCKFELESLNLNIIVENNDGLTLTVYI